ncbi:response regulator transcription factor [Lactobacillus sp. PV037]|uniref:response regulator transcription factor n=1 Tax=unclassified Lactobacillus TaxID=2620435 RepID=UPI00223FFD30|nr:MULTISPECIES: response regulator transcription factor [unclassified Lactobacillus]QNQ82046.1 response regulator transcription factor [Lactobacillus sp. PV012]QNQ83919.1 response regulator transcription factor [Lactobacillus sp. PV037]
MKILIAEDEEQLSHVLVAAMQHEGHEVTAVENGKEAVEKVSKNSYDIIILDIMMPVMDGITALKKIRESGNKSYILMLTAKSEIDDRVLGLDTGADDYLTKPFSLKELLARLRSKKRRDDTYTPDEIKIGDLCLNVPEQELISENSIRLNSKETQVMNYLLLNQGKEISTQEIFNQVWKNEDDVTSEIVWIYISYLRQKLRSIQSEIKILGEKDGSFKIEG